MDVGKTPAAIHNIKYTITIMSVSKPFFYDYSVQYDKDDDQ